MKINNRCHKNIQGNGTRNCVYNTNSLAIVTTVITALKGDALIDHQRHFLCLRIDLLQFKKAAKKE